MTLGNYEVFLSYRTSEGGHTFWILNVSSYFDFISSFCFNSMIPDRMPLVIGSFISRHVYNQKLMTVHNNNSRAACRFLDVKRGQEQKLGKSWAVRFTSRPS